MCLVHACKHIMLNINPRILNFNPYIIAAEKSWPMFYTYRLYL